MGELPLILELHWFNMLQRAKKKLSFLFTLRFFVRLISFKGRLAFFLSTATLFGLCIQCTGDRGASSNNESIIFEEGQPNKLFNEVLGIDSSNWAKFIEELGQKPARDYIGKSLNAPICFQDAKPAPEALLDQSCPAPSLNRSDESFIPRLTAEYWKEIGFDPLRLTVGQFKKAVSIFRSPDPSGSFSLVEPAQGIKQKTKVCVRLAKLYGRYKQAKHHPDCFERAKKMSELVLDPNTYHDLIHGSEVVNVASRAAHLFFPNKNFTRELRLVNGVNQCVVLPAHRLRQGLIGLSQTFGDAVLDNSL